MFITLSLTINFKIRCIYCTSEFDIDGKYESQVIEVIKQKPEVRKISFVAHSVGGLVARYAIGRLYKPPKSDNEEDSSTDTCEEDSRGTIHGLEAMNFITVATPHLGSRGNKQVQFILSPLVF